MKPVARTQEREIICQFIYIIINSRIKINI